MDHLRFPCIPLLESTAEPHIQAGGSQASRHNWAFVPGQRLEGHMIPVVEDLVAIGTDIETVTCE